jgi:serine/threonine-protein kinase
VPAVTSVRSFGRYRVTGALGAGAMGEVYAAVDEVLGREVAVKTLRSHASGLAARMLDDRFRQEARAIAALHHVGVVQVFDIDLSADPPYLVMERMVGPSLKERLADGPLGANELRTLGIQIARALAAAHAAGIVHRDVKPANILGAGAAGWKLADFGVAHVPDSSLTMTGQFVGSPAYAPPEALVRGVSGSAGDVFGLGATLYEAAAGRWPRIEDTSGALLAPLPPLAQLVPALPPDVAAVIDRSVAIDPSERPSAAELADALAGAASLPMRAVALPAQAAPAPRWRPWAIGGAAVLAFVVLVSTRGAAPPGASLPPGSPALPGLLGPAASAAQPVAPISPPPGMDGKQTRDWNKIFDELDKGHHEGARRKLDDFADRYGETDETRALRPQLDALGPDQPRGRGSRGKTKRDDD